MIIRTIRRDERVWEFKIFGEDHTFCNLLRDVLSRDPRVRFVAYRIRHPLIEHPEFRVEVEDGESLEEVLRDAANKIGEMLREFREGFEKSLQEKS